MIWITDYGLFKVAGGSKEIKKFIRKELITGFDVRVYRKFNWVSIFLVVLSVLSLIAGSYFLLIRNIIISSSSFASLTVIASILSFWVRSFGFTKKVRLVIPQTRNGESLKSWKIIYPEEETKKSDIISFLSRRAPPQPQPPGSVL